MMHKLQHKSSFTHQTGVALVQVLLITAVLMLMALQFTLSGRQQVVIATDVLSKVDAEVALRTLESRLLFSLLTQTKSSEGDLTNQEDIISEVWNFHNQEFSPYENTKIQIQGLNNLVSIYGNMNNDLLTQLIINYGKTNAEAKSIVNEIQQWQGNQTSSMVTDVENARGDFVNSIHELKLLPSIDDGLIAYLKKYITIYPTPSINPMLAPENVLMLFVGKDIVNEIVMLRSTGQLSRENFVELTQIFEDDTISFSPSNRMKIKLKVTHNNVVATKEMICYIRPENSFPIVWF